MAAVAKVKFKFSRLTFKCDNVILDYKFFNFLDFIWGRSLWMMILVLNDLGVKLTAAGKGSVLHKSEIHSILRSSFVVILPPPLLLLLLLLLSQKTSSQRWIPSKAPRSEVLPIHFKSYNPDPSP